jgi:TfoX/Sxy family transcriptional regulator of competence genes
VPYHVHLADRIRSILQSAGEFSEKRMFGGLAFMVNGHMCCGVLKTDLVLRLAPGEADAALREPHTRPMDFTGKPMKSMIYVSATGTDSDQALAKWVESAVKLARSTTQQATRARRITSSGSAVREPAISRSASKRAARKRG